LKTLFADNVFSYINLYPASRSLQMGKTGLPHQPVGHDSTCDTNVLLRNLEKRWDRSIRDWTMALGQFAIFFQGRLPVA